MSGWNGTRKDGVISRTMMTVAGPSMEPGEMPTAVHSAPARQNSQSF